MKFSVNIYFGQQRERGVQEKAMITIRHVADLAGVSIGTVSRFFHEPHRVREDTRARIQQAVEALDYTPNILAQNFRAGSTGIVRVLASSMGDPFYGTVIEGIASVAARNDYSVHVQPLLNGSFSNRDLRDIIQARQADGLLILGSQAPPLVHDSRTRQKVVQPKIVVCGETSDPELLGFPRFQIDGFAAMQEVTDYLISLNHREIAYIGGTFGPIILSDREAGFRASMARAGLKVHEPHVISDSFEMAGGRRAIQSILNSGTMPTAVVCATDEMAFGAMAVLHSRGLSIPGDISITGMDDTRYADVSNPRLTTVAQPGRAIGEGAMLALLQAIRSGESAPRVEILPHQFIIRASTAPPPSR